MPNFMLRSLAACIKVPFQVYTIFLKAVKVCNLLYERYKILVKLENLEKGSKYKVWI